jgi:hypothetical protein
MAMAVVTDLVAVAVVGMVSCRVSKLQWKQ